MRRIRLDPVAALRLTALTVLAVAACGGGTPGSGGPGTAAAGPLPDGPRDGTAGAADGWVPLFNGRDLTGWTPKIRGLPAGRDPAGTFRVVPDPEGWDGGRQGLLTVAYDGYEGDFDDRFGHLFFADPYADYDLLVEYRFTGEQAPGGPAWAWRNSGVMLHAQPPGSMGLEQDFPISLELQLLGGGPDGSRPTANLCTPGTEVTVAGRRAAEHCVPARAPTVRDDAWVTVVVRVRGSREITHLVRGDEVLRYGDLRVGGGFVSGHDPGLKRDGAPLGQGYIALQSESHPVQFRRIWIRTGARDGGAARAYR